MPTRSKHEWEDITAYGAPMGLVLNQWQCRKCGAIKTDWNDKLEIPKGRIPCKEG
jgi:hypothetical protein